LGSPVPKVALRERAHSSDDHPAVLVGPQRASARGRGR